MREIKFRVWNKKDKLMQDIYDICFLNGGVRVSGTGVYMGNGWATEANGFEHRCDVVLMQFTGLKDINGVDIYEGDIIKVTSSITTDIFSVEISMGNTCYASKPEHALGSIFPTMISMKKEVIGNIHENPELLEQG